MTEPIPRDPDAFQALVDASIPEAERREMTASAERVAGLRAIHERVTHEHHRAFLYADEHPEALQEFVNPTIRIPERSDAWSLHAGWVRIVNRLHADLVGLLGDYVVVEMKAKGAGLMIRTSPYASTEAHDRFLAARSESGRTCDLCGEPGTRSSRRFMIRCRRHAVTRDTRIPGALARRPGWRP